MPSTRRLTVTQNITVDGVIEATGGWFSPAGDEADVDNSDIETTLQEHMQAQEALLLGRATFESFRGYWPAQTEDTTGITAHLNQVPKYVVSTTLEDPEWENTTVLRGPAVDEVAALKGQPGGEIGVTGSITLVHDLIAAGLVDEYRLFVYPVVQGRGRRLFPEGFEADRLRVVDVAGFDSGVTLLHYAAR